MGITLTPEFGEQLTQLVLRGRTAEPLVCSDDDAKALGHIVKRMLFWCGGGIYAWRSEGNEMRFAMQVKKATLYAMAHHISNAYAKYVRKTWKLTGSIFKHYTIVPMDDAVYLDELVLWLHRPSEHSRVWTTEAAYLRPGSIDWVDTRRILTSMSPGSPVPATYLRFKSEAIPQAALEAFKRRPQRTSRDLNQVSPIDLEYIARWVAAHSGVSYEDMLADTRKRPVSKARAIATVLATRNGISAAAAARLFNRSRSSLIEQVEYYRKNQPNIFTAAEQEFDALLAEAVAHAPE
jgi:hypothetical protein